MDMERYDTEAEYQSKKCNKHKYFFFIFLICLILFFFFYLETLEIVQLQIIT